MITLTIIVSVVMIWWIRIAHEKGNIVYIFKNIQSFSFMIILKTFKRYDNCLSKTFETTTGDPGSFQESLGNSPRGLTLAIFVFRVSYLCFT